MQAQVRPVISSSFKPAWGLKHAHLQTIFAKYLSPRHKQKTVAEQFSLPDGDVIQLNWMQPSKVAANAPMVVILHGLAGDINSHYIQGLLAQCRTLRWPAVMMHFRGCNGVANKLPRAYHSGDTADFALFLQQCRQRYPARRLMAIGFSLGGNVLVKYCGESGSQNLLSAAVAVCAPLALAPSSDRINQGFSKVYQRYLLGRLKGTMQRKLAAHADFPLPISASDIRNIRSIRQFDNCLTAPLHGFRDAEDYYQRASAKPFLASICRPSLLIHAKDDPFLSDAVIPSTDELNPHIHYELTRGGGHVGFVYGSVLKPKFWLNQRIPQFIQWQLNK